MAFRPDYWSTVHRPKLILGGCAAAVAHLFDLSDTCLTYQGAFFMKMSCLRIPVFLLLSFFPGNFFAQGESITVQVQDPSGLPVSGASVSLSLPSGLEVASNQTQASGRTNFRVASGFYRLNVVTSGFTPFQTELVVRSGEAVGLVVELQMSSLATEINVLASPSAQIAVEEIPREVLESGPPRGLAERLKGIPSVLTVRRGGANLEPVVQGLREYQLVMVVDGARTFAAGPARMDSEISHVDPAQVIGLEVIKGPLRSERGRRPFCHPGQDRSCARA